MANIEHFGGSLIIHLNCKDKSEITIKKKPDGLLRIASCSIYRKPDVSLQSFDLFLKQVHYSITFKGFRVQSFKSPLGSCNQWMTKRLFCHTRMWF